MRLVCAAARLAVALTLCAGLNFAPHASARTSSLSPEPFDSGAVNRQIDACANFFAYATGRYTAAHPIPPAYTEYGYNEELEDRTREIIRAIVVRAQRTRQLPGSNLQKIGTFYSSCMDTATIERRGLAPLVPELARIAAIAAPADVPVALAHLHGIGVDAGFALNSTPDIRETDKIIAEIDQGGLGMPERDYYLRTDADSRKLRAQYVAHVAKMLQLSGAQTSFADARSVVALETRFARAAKPVAALREPEATYHPLPLHAVSALAPHSALPAYLRAGDVRVARLNLAEPEFLRAFDRSLVETPLSTWRTYLRWRLIDTFAATLPDRLEREDFAFHGHILNGMQAQLPRWKRCVNAANDFLGEAVGQAYVAATFPPSAKARAVGMTLRIKRAYRAKMEALTWMTPATRRIAIAKLDALGLKVGYPVKWRDYSAYAVRPDAYVANVKRGHAFERRFALAKIGRPDDRAEWSMTPQTVNAYNDQNRNEIVLPAAALQRPFFDPAVDDAANLGSIGAGWIGHEMTHGFDDEGHKFDARGNLRNWWTPRDSAQFDARAQCVIQQFDRTVAVGAVHYQGRLVSGEAIADLGGLVIGYQALQSALGAAPGATIDGFTPEQRYFLAYAQSWSEVVRPEAARTQALTDPHPLPRDRVNNTVANVPAWYAAFKCAPPPRPECAIW